MQVANQKFPTLPASEIDQIIRTLTRARLGRYLFATRNHAQRALRLYVMNGRISSALLGDLHYFEIVLRNRFAGELRNKFGDQWFQSPDFLGLLDARGQRIVERAQKDASKNWTLATPLPQGKVIAELTFGFWHALTDSKLEHKLWVPCLHRAFAPRKAPKRAIFNQQLEQLRQLRNRVAHHEPIFHLDLQGSQRLIFDITRSLSPATARLMSSTSMVRREVMSLRHYERRWAYSAKNKP